ncbi:hypothetical protein K504DRAFT_271995 [Pleomassaria siparia CBS 279.74]|uniref:Uncharacterized protein n=1 Tax=Pleomassaria siparia CBS 279.74 TaxID=1314801 RepID=A0A6G1K969_9PLEO|nr:hypothetical protein K504DRAFT_271995 [Pleomassaria siparia CBS 279.74]
MPCHAVIHHPMIEFKKNIKIQHVQYVLPIVTPTQPNPPHMIITNPTQPNPTQKRRYELPKTTAIHMYDCTDQPTNPRWPPLRHQQQQNPHGLASKGGGGSGIL